FPKSIMDIIAGRSRSAKNKTIVFKPDRGGFGSDLKLFIESDLGLLFFRSVLGLLFCEPPLGLVSLESALGLLFDFSSDVLIKSGTASSEILPGRILDVSRCSLEA